MLQVLNKRKDTKHLKVQGAILMVGQSRRSFLKGSAAAASVIGMRPVAALAQTRRMDELIDEDATGLAERLRAREFTQAELVETFIRRVEVMNPALNFMTNTAFDRARLKADTIPLDAPFAGVPILMKEVVAEIRTSC
jgi:amidase